MCSQSTPPVIYLPPPPVDQALPLPLLLLAPCRSERPNKLSLLSCQYPPYLLWCPTLRLLPTGTLALPPPCTQTTHFFFKSPPHPPIPAVHLHPPRAPSLSTSPQPCADAVQHGCAHPLPVPVHTYGAEYVACKSETEDGLVSLFDATANTSPPPSHSRARHKRIGLAFRRQRLSISLACKSETEVG